MSDEILKATHKGALEIGDVKIPCAVLEDGTRVLSETGITKAILKTRSGAANRRKKGGAPLPIFLSSGTLEPFIPNDLKSGALLVQYQDGSRTITGYRAEVLPIVCDVWLSAREAGALHASQYDKAQNAEILMRGLANVGIIALVDEATGYQESRDRNELQKFLSMYLSEEKLHWAKMFPDEYYKQLFRLKGWTYKPLSVKRPRLVGKLTNQLVYEKLPANVIEELRKLNPVKNKKSGRRGAAHFQYLSADLGQPDLRDHLLQLIAIMRASPNWTTFIRNFERAFPSQGGEQIYLEEFED